MKKICGLVLILMSFSISAISAEVQFTDADNQTHSIPLESGEFGIRASAGFDGWYTYQDAKGEVWPENFYINGKDAQSATTIVRGNDNQLRFYSKHDGVFVQDTDKETSRKVIAKLLGSIKKEWLLYIGDGSESEAFVELGSACGNSKNLEAQLLKDKTPHTILRVASGGAELSEEKSESFNCLSEKGVREWTTYNGNPKPKKCGKSLASRAGEEIGIVISRSNAMRGSKKLTLPKVFTKEIYGDW